MKIKSIIACGLLLLGVGAATTSCEDMMTAENKLVTTNLAPQDTLYQMMGIVQRMQKLADRTILLGEVRADLVDVDATRASSDLQELANNSISTTNAYNSPSEYYAVINSCNIYLTYVDSLYMAYGEYKYQKEIISAKCFRAWCYLELAKIYGEVPFVTEPVLTTSAADDILKSGTRKDLLGILDFAIADISPYAYLPENNELRPSYGATFGGVGARYLFLPVRALLGELYLWRGSAKGRTAGHDDFVNAIRMYHDYFTFPGEEINADYNACEWSSNDWTRSNNLTYSTNFNISSTSSFAAVLPLDTAAYYGNTSDLRALFNSVYSNNYYPSIIPSTRMTNISQSQKYAFYTYSTVTGADTTFLSESDKPSLSDERKFGDLRYSSVYLTESNISESRYNSNVNSEKQYITKWTGGSQRLSDDRRQTYIFYYRTNTLYLHMAEALNLAGFPETAYAVLAYGLTSNVFNNSRTYFPKEVRKSDGTIIEMDVVSANEFSGLCDIKSYGFTNTTTDYDADATRKAKAANSFVVWKSTVFDNIQKANTPRSIGSWNTGSSSTRKIQYGIHSIGSGDTEYNKYYYLDDQATIDNLNQGVKPDQPEGGYVEGQPALAYDAWSAITTQTPNTTNYDLYVAEYNSYPTRLANFKADSTYLASSTVLAKRQDHLRWLILQEEALEGSFEGQRFYDLLRHQMQDGKVSGKAATITMPDSITKLYGATTKMDGKPWYMTLPSK